MRVAICHPELKHKANNMCQRCYDRYRYKTDPVKRRERIVRWVKNNHEKELTRKRNWRRNNLSKDAAYSSKRRALRRKAVPVWLTTEHLTEIKSFYVNRPNGYEVDHIVPLKGKNVSGLHVPWNLCYLTKSENASKGNRFEIRHVEAPASFAAAERTVC